jgi:phthiocerol/phenolphthiocerol synthesis type-I polyketide synthase E
MASNLLGDAAMGQVHEATDNPVAQLTHIWEKLLGIDLIGADQNYFDLGGDSVMAVHLFSQIESEFNVKLPLATLFEAPTINELAAILRREAPATGWSPLVPIQPNGSRLPFFCIHGAGGNVLIYRELSRNLGTDQPFYGLQAQGLDGKCPPLTKIEEMAALYAKAIRTQQRNGPYMIGGYCGGGLIAFEVARQLRSEGEEIALLAMFDTMNFSLIRPFTFWSRTYYDLQRLVFHAANFIRLDFSGKLSFFQGKLSSLRGRLPVWWGWMISRFNGNSSSAGSEFRVLGEIWKLNDLACQRYVPQPFDGVITDVRPLKQYRVFDQLSAKWDQLATRGQRVVVLPVYPAGMLIEPFVQHLAKALRNAIDDAITTQVRCGSLPRPTARAS